MVQMSAKARAERRGAGEADDLPPTTHNRPPVALPGLDLTPEQWIEWMETVFAEAAERKSELLPSFQRFEAGFPLSRGPAGEPPKGIEKWNDEIQGRAGDLKDKLAALKKQAESLHSLEKAPVLAAGRAIDRYKNTFLVDVETAIRTVNERRTLYALHKEQESRRAAEAAARQAQEEAARLAAEAQATLEPEKLEEAAQAYQDAAAAQEHAEAKPAEHSRTFGPMGSVSSLRSNWTYELQDLMQLVQAVAAGKVPLFYLQVNETRVRVAIRTEHVREIPGLRVFDDMKVR